MAPLSLKTKVCIECKKCKVISEFRAAKNYRRRCHSCYLGVSTFSKYGNQLSESERKKIYKRAAYMKNRYNITMDQYQSMLSSQGGVCAICKRLQTDQYYAVDHDHSCCAGKKSCGRCVRGLLCKSCNSGLGCFRDNLVSLRAATSYLEGWSLDEDTCII